MKRKLGEFNLPNGSKLFRGENTGLMFYPTLPEKRKFMEDVNGYVPDYDVVHPNDYPQWVKNMHSEHATVQLWNGQVVWLGGTIHDGIWMDGLFLGGRWRDGIWYKGTWKTGIWSTGEWYAGDFLDGKWIDGVFFGGRFYGDWRGGVFMGGEFYGTWRGGVWGGGKFKGIWQRTDEPPPPGLEYR